MVRDLVSESNGEHEALKARLDSMLGAHRLSMTKLRNPRRFDVIEGVRRTVQSLRFVDSFGAQVSVPDTYNSKSFFRSLLKLLVPKIEIAHGDTSDPALCEIRGQV